MTISGKTSSVLSILYVDDEEDLLHLCKTYLEDYGDFNVTISISPLEAIHLLSDQVFDAIISDYQMADMNGIEFLKFLKAKGDNTPFIIFTGKGREEVVIEAINAGVDFYLQKGGSPNALFAELSHKVRKSVARMRAEEELRNEREKYTKAFLSVPEVIIISEINSGVYLEINEAVSNVFGYNREELIGKSELDIGFWCYQEDRTDLITRLQKHEKVRNFEVRQFRKSGEEFTAEISADIITLGTKEVLLTVVHDITDRKLAEETINKALTEKETLLREVHHRVKNNLVGIVALINLQISSLTDPVLISHLKELETRIRSMEFVHELLYLSGDISRIDTTTYINTLSQYLILMYKTKAKVRCRVESESVTMPIETAIPFGLVISEIVSNSLKYAFPDTFFCKEKRGEENTISITLKSDGKVCLLEIADNGIGVTSGIDDSLPGSLGLYLIRFIVEHQLQGSLEINNTEGTMYTIRFPLSAYTEGHSNE